MSSYIIDNHFKNFLRTNEIHHFTPLNRHILYYKYGFRQKCLTIFFQKFEKKNYPHKLPIFIKKICEYRENEGNFPIFHPPKSSFSI